METSRKDFLPTSHVEFRFVFRVSVEACMLNFLGALVFEID